jgi:hypothetical protein
MFLGDDDAVLPGAAVDLMALVDRFRDIDAISWPSIEYGWPSCTVEELRSVAVIPLTRGLERRSARNVLSDVVNFRRPYAELPFIYKGLIRTSAVQKLRVASGGHVFHSRIPDVYFGIAACAVIDDYVFSRRPYTLNGASSHSNGTSTFAAPEAKDAEQKFLSEENLPFHPELQYCPSIPVLIVESLLQAKERLPVLSPYFSGFDMMVRASVSQAERAAPNVFADVISTLEGVASRNALSAETQAVLRKAHNKPYQSAKPIYGLDLYHNRYLANCDDFGVRDCYGASILANTLLHIHESDSLSNVAGIANLLKLSKRYLSRGIGLS